MVSTQWRRAFDRDRIWKKRCTFHPNYFIKQGTEQRISSKNFFSGCESKKRVLQELQVEKNFVQGKYHIVRVDSGRQYCDNLLDVVDEAGNHWLFVSCELYVLSGETPHQIEVWNMNNEPYKHQSKETSLFSPDGMYDSRMSADKNKLYYTVQNFLVVLEFSHPEYSLIILLKLDLFDSMEFLRGSKMFQPLMVYKANLFLGFAYTSGHAKLLKEPWVLVWDENTSLLYKNYSTNQLIEIQAQTDDKFRYCHLISVKVGSTSDNVLLTYYKDNYKTISVVLLFNTKTFQMTTLFEKRNVIIAQYEFVNEVVVLLYYKLPDQSEKGNVPRLICYSTDGGIIYETVLRSNQNHNIHSMVTANEGKEVLVLESCGEITVFDVFQQKEIFQFRTPYDVCIIETFIKNNFVIVNHKYKAVCTVWDFKSGKRLYGFDELQNIKLDFYDLCLANSYKFSANPYKFSFMKSYRSPPKIFGIRKDYYGVVSSKFGNCEILVISFV